MPNGGPDNCGTCGFNRACDGEWDRYPLALTTARSDHLCLIRGIAITHPLWTYCVNRHTRSPQPDGPIYAQGLYETGYCRIPWHDAHEPRTYVPGACSICGRPFEKGIEIDTESGQVRQFCCNAHYVRWWKDAHPDEDLMWDYVWHEPE